MPTKKTSLLPFLSLLAGIVSFSTVEICGKKIVVTGANIDPFLMVFVRFLITGIVLTALGLPAFLVKNRLQFTDWANFFVNGLIGIAASLVLFHAGVLMFAKASSAAVVFSANALFAVFLARFINNEKLSWNKVLAVLIGVAGIACFVCENGAPSRGAFKALLVMASSALWFAVSVCFTKRVVARYGATLFMGMSSIFGALLILPVAFTRVSPSYAIQQIGIAFWPMCYMVFIGTTLAYALYYYGLAGSSTFAASMAFFLKPVLACLLARWYLGNRMNVWTLSG
ncbi:MAG: EamA family transporter, partial [Victivallales bacterium]|nr:EamA family transporter [Victivallales bacterium]